jgi:hypothetical protein
MLSLSGTGRRPSKPLPCEAGNTSLRPEARTASGATVLYRPGHQAPPADHRATDRSPSPAAAHCAALHADPGPADATNALISFRTSASCPRNR